MNTNKPECSRESDPDPLLRVPEAAARLGVCRRTLEYWLAAGRIPFCALGPRSRRILTSDLQAFIRSRRVGGVGRR